MQRYYIGVRASATNFFYPGYEIRQHLRTVGGVKNIRVAHKFGWNNLPRVLTFNCDEITASKVQDWLPDNLIMHLHWKHTS